MGYRPYIYIKEEGWQSGIELSKFYGYVNLNECKSVDWLVDHNKVKDPNIFNYTDLGPDIEFTAEEFREWITLYLSDIATYRETHNIGYYDLDEVPHPVSFDEYPELKDIYDDNGPKMVEWG